MPPWGEEPGGGSRPLLFCSERMWSSTTVEATGEGTQGLTVTLARQWAVASGARPKPD